jgi:signal transduction histidine kinase
MELNKALNDSMRVRILCKLSQGNVGLDSLASFKLAEEALELSKKNKDTSGLANAYFAFGYNYASYDNTKRAKEYYGLAKEHYDRIINKNPSELDTRLWVMSTYNLGVVYGREGYVNEEVRSMREVTPMVEKLQDKNLVAILNSNLGIRFSNMGKYEKAHEYFTKAMKQFENSERRNEEVYNLLAFSQCLYDMDSIGAMDSVLKKSRILLEGMPKAKEWPYYYSNLGLYQTAIGKYQEAISSYDEAFTRIQKNKITYLLEGLYLQYAITYDSLRNYPKAKEFAQRHLKELNYDELGGKLMNAYKVLADLEYKDNNYKKAYDYILEHTALKDSAKIDSVNSEMQQLELLYQTEKKEKEILQLTNTNNETELALERKLSQGYLLTTIIAVLLAGAYFLYRKKQQQIKINRQKHEEEMNLLKHEQQAKIFSAMIDSQEKERRRIAIELHDGLGGRLSAIGLKLMNNVPDKIPPQIEQPIKEFKNDLDDSLNELRSIARNLMPETLSKYGLKAALTDYCNSVQDDQTKIVFQYYSTAEILDDSTSLTIFRIIQELINNALKHSKATDILVQYMADDNKIDVTVEDNGVGFSVDEIAENKGMGLTTLKTRVEYINGKMDVTSFPNEGTTINIIIDQLKD